MKHWLVWLTLVLLTLGLAGCGSGGDEGDFYILYSYQTDVTYERVEIRADRLTYTYFDDYPGNCVGWEEPKPCWQEDQLIVREATLTGDEIEQLKSTARSTGFFSLKSTYGGGSENQRTYPEKLLVKADGQRNEVTCITVKDEEVQKPDAFDKLIFVIYQIIVEKF